MSLPAFVPGRRLMEASLMTHLMSRTQLAVPFVVPRGGVGILNVYGLEGAFVKRFLTAGAAMGTKASSHGMQSDVSGAVKNSEEKKNQAAPAGPHVHLSTVGGRPGSAFRI